MIIVRLMGRLGNQMFQYAAGKALALHKGTTLKMDLDFMEKHKPQAPGVVWEYNLDIFALGAERANIKEIERYFRADTEKTLWNRLRQRVCPTICFHEPSFRFQENFFDLPSNTLLIGYWQSPRYFSAYEDTIRQDFQFVSPILPTSRLLLERIQSEESIAVVVRRTDLLTNKEIGFCDMRYFQPAMRYIRQRCQRPYFFVFSDDPSWCIENFTDTDTTIVTHEHLGTKFSNYLQLMSRCRHFIISNSTYAWWAVWFNRNPHKIVIAPKRWFANPQIDTSDLIPSDWIRMEN